MNALTAIAPRACSSGRAPTFPGMRPPHRAKSACDTRDAIAAFSSNDAPSRVRGRLLRGMSPKVVPPPATRARLPVDNPSQSARPGSLKWTCVSTAPGKACRPVASNSAVPAGATRPGATAVIVPSSARMSATAAPSGPTTVAPRKSIRRIMCGLARRSRASEGGARRRRKGTVRGHACPHREWRGIAMVNAFRAPTPSPTPAAAGEGSGSHATSDAWSAGILARPGCTASHG